jgi:predicted Zn-dependent protease
MLTKEDCKKLIARTMEASKAEAVSMSISDRDTTHIRFARNGPTTSGANSVPSLSLTSSFGKRSGSVTINQFDTESLVAGLRRSESMARLAPEDPEHMPGLEPTQYAKIEAYDEATAQEGHEVMAAGVSRCIQEAQAAGLTAAGFSESSAGVSCIANSRGLFGFHPSTHASLSETARTKDGTGSGWASSVGHRAGDVDYANTSRIALEKGQASAGVQPLPPGEYPTILEPACVANMVQLLTGAMDARRADEGRSFFSTPKGTRLGEQLFDKKIHITSDPSDLRVPSRPWGSESLPVKARSWIDEGRAATLRSSRYWAQKKGSEAISRPMNTIMKGGSGSLLDLIRSTKRAVLVTSIWYIRSVDPQSLLHTGLTRDGVFWIEDGKIKHPITNFRWNESPIAVFKKVEEMSESVRVSPRGSRSGGFLAPALRVSGFQFSSVSEAV